MINKVREIHDFIISDGRAASIPVPEQLPETIVTEMINGVLVSKPLKKVTDLNKKNKTETETTTLTNESEQEITTLNYSWERQHSKAAAAAASVQGINKIREIHDFVNNGY